MWKIAEIQNIGGSIHVRATQGPISCEMQGPCDANQYVDFPSFIERLLGITFDDKVKQAIKRCQRWCDKQNEKEKRGEELIRGFIE